MKATSFRLAAFALALAADGSVYTDIPTDRSPP